MGHAGGPKGPFLRGCLENAIPAVAILLFQPDPLLQPDLPHHKCHLLRMLLVGGPPSGQVSEEKGNSLIVSKKLQEPISPGKQAPAE
jgi:hypothetical protein